MHFHALPKMNTPLRRFQILESRTWTQLLSLLAGLALVVGCATSRQVREIVATSNAAALQATLGVTDFGGAASGTNAVQAIDQFIAAHPDQPKTIAALRLRQAMLLLTQRRFNLAQAAFNEVKPEQLVTARDLALKRLQDELLWFYRHSTDNPVDAAQGDRTLAALQKGIAELDVSVRKGAVENEEIRDRLAELRVQLGLSVARAFPPLPMRQRVEQAINEYSRIFTPADLRAMRQEGPWMEVTAINPSIKRRAGAVAPVIEAKRLSEDLEPRPRFESPDFQALITGP